MSLSGENFFKKQFRIRVLPPQKSRESVKISLYDFLIPTALRMLQVTIIVAPTN